MPFCLRLGLKMFVEQLWTKKLKGKELSEWALQA